MKTSAVHSLADRPVQRPAGHTLPTPEPEGRLLFRAKRVLRCVGHVWAFSLCVGVRSGLQVPANSVF